MKKRLQDMLVMQAKLNDITNGPDWRDGVTKANRVINWYRCIRQEGGEFIDSFPWKHWKSIDVKADLPNARTELTDVWHFYLAAFLVRYQTLSISEIADKLDETFRTINTPKYDYDPVIAMEELIENTFVSNEDIRLRLILDAFVTLLVNVDMNMDDLYKKYISKNVLNIFRQENGYTEGTYVKMWNGLEDNVVLDSLMSINPTIGADGLKELLTVEYVKVK